MALEYPSKEGSMLPQISFFNSILFFSDEVSSSVQVFRLVGSTDIVVLSKRNRGDWLKAVCTRLSDRRYLTGHPARAVNP